jgi:sortase B
VNIDKLKSKNPDSIGYLKINGIGIEIPVVQGKNNEFYLHHSFDKSDNSAG